MLRRCHRILGAALVLPLLVWTATGLLFLVKPGWSGAYEPLQARREEPVDLGQVVPLALAAGEAGALARVELASTALGPLYFLSGIRGLDGAGPDTRLVDARTGAVLSPLGREAGARIAADAAARAHASERYGAVVEAREDGDAIAVNFAGGALVRVGRSDLSLSQSGPDTALIDALYRMHYLQWTGIAALDRALVLAAIAGTWTLAALGLWLLRRRKDG